MIKNMEEIKRIIRLKAVSFIYPSFLIPRYAKELPIDSL
jgi:hypothetical protein